MTDKEPKIYRVPSPGDGKYLEQIERAGRMLYAHYQPANGTIGYDTYQPKENDEDKIIHLHPLKTPMWPLAGEPEEPGETLWADVKSFIYAHVDFPDPRFYDVVTGWIFATWIMEAFSTTGLLRFYGPRGTGKTRGQEVLLLLCYRAYLSPSVTEAALFRLIESYHVTFLLDETERYGDDVHKTIQGILNAGYRRGQHIPRCATAEDGSIYVEGFEVYGPKSISGTEPLKDTLESRTIPIVMERARRKVNYEPDRAEAKRLRSRLLLWRFRRLRDLDALSEASERGEASEGLEEAPPELHQVKDSRIVEIFGPLLALAPDAESRGNILDFALSVYDEATEEDATGAEAQIVAAIKRIYPKVDSGKFSTNDVAESFNAEKTEHERWKTSSVGRLIKKLGFKPKRMTGGRSGWIYDADRLDRLSERYGGPPLLQPSQPSQPSLPSFTEPVEPKTVLSEKLTQLGEALRGTGSRGAKPETLAEGTGIPIEETRQLLNVLQRDRLAFAAPGDTWRWVA